MLIGPRQITRENNQRFITIQANVVGRDIGGFVKEAQQLIDREVTLPAGYYVTWGGQFELAQQANQRLMLVVPITLIMICLLLYLSFNSLKNTALILLNIPLALVGGVIRALAVRREPVRARIRRVHRTVRNSSGERYGVVHIPQSTDSGRCINRRCQHQGSITARSPCPNDGSHHGTWVDTAVICYRNRQRSPAPTGNSCYRWACNLNCIDTAGLAGTL